MSRHVRFLGLCLWLFILSNLSVEVVWSVLAGIECSWMFVCMYVFVCVCVCVQPSPTHCSPNHRDRSSRIPTLLPRRREASIDCRAAFLWKHWMPTGRGPPLIRANERQIDRMRDRDKTTVSLGTVCTVRAGSVQFSGRRCLAFCTDGL